MIAKEIKKPASKDDIAAHAKRVFTARDKQILANHEPIAETIALTFGKGCEVVIHSLEDLGKSIVKIFNGEVTGRVLGAPITDMGLKVASKAVDTTESVIGPYFSKTKTGKPLKTTTMIIRNDEGTPIGFLCINFDLSISQGRISLPTWANSSARQWPTSWMPYRASPGYLQRRKTAASSPISSSAASST